MGALRLPDELPALPPVAYEGMSLEEYFAFEEHSKEKHDYWNGKLYAMAGGTINHNRIVSNGIYALRKALDNSTYEVFPSDLRIQAHAMKIYTYPDITVLCEAPDFYNNRKDTITNPRLLIEVLSPSTEDYDRSKKFILYRLIPSLEEYVIISSTQVAIEVFRKQNIFQWEWSFYSSLDAVIVLSSISVTLTAKELYRHVDIDPEEQQAD